MRYKFLRFPNGLRKAVTFSYDDGCRSDIRLADTLNKYGIKCTFNINNGFIPEKDGEWHLTEQEIRENIINAGHEIAVHGEEHRALGKLRAIDGISDVLNCRLGLEKRFGMIIRGMAYPDSGITAFANGADYENIKRYLKDLDIVYSRTLGADNDGFELPTDWLAWVPTAHHVNPNVLDYIEKFNAIEDKGYGASLTPKLLYLWGHSFEYENNDNWDLLEKICERLSGREDVWYATNIEIYDYVTAYDRLVYSADGATVYNPTLIDVWISVDSVVKCVKSGETVKLI